MYFLDINNVLIFSFITFFIGFFGLTFNRKNILLSIMSVEIVLLAINLSFAAISVYLDDIIGHIFIIFILTIAATESAIGLAILVTLFRLKFSIRLDPIKLTKF